MMYGLKTKRQDHEKGETFHKLGLFQCELLCFGDVGCIIPSIKLDGTSTVVLKALKIHLEELSLSRNHDPVTHDNPQSLLRAG